MPPIDRLMKKLGYVKLSSFGLVLTPDDRVLSMRSAVLDDGVGGKIVGWQDGDLAAAELEKWAPAQPVTRRAVATRVAPPAVPRSIPNMVIRETSLPIDVAQVPSIRPPTPKPVPVPVPAPVVNVAPAPVAEEDDWEWTIAVARARAAADEAELAAAQPPPPAPISASPKFVAAKTLPIAKVAAAPEEWEEGPKTEPLQLQEVDYNDYTSPMADIVRVAKLANTPRVVLPAKATPPKAMPVVVPVVAAPVAAQNHYPRAKSPVTVIPVPKLPTVANPRALHITPAMKAPSIAPAAAPRTRFAKGTGPYLPKTEPDTVVGNEPSDDTVPSMVLPRALPSIVKRASRG